MSERERACVPVHDGRRYFGKIAEAQPSRFEAVKPDGESLGLYNNATAAAHALIAAARAKSAA